MRTICVMSFKCKNPKARLVFNQCVIEFSTITFYLLFFYSLQPNENIFDLNFEIREPLLGGDSKSVELIKNGANIAVTMANREEYVRRYIDYVLNDSCELQFNALKKGFYQVCGQYLGRLFHPTELRNVVLGNDDVFKSGLGVALSSEVSSYELWFLDSCIQASCQFKTCEDELKP